MSTHTDVTNAKRAAWANAAVYLFEQLTGCDREDALGDLLGDLMHWARQNNFDFDLALSRAKGHFEEECAEEEAIALTISAPDLFDALLDIKLLAQKHDDNGYDPYTLLEEIESKALAVLAKAKGGAQ
jgi:hypothetical protein